MKDKKLLFQRGQIENSGLCIGFSIFWIKRAQFLRNYLDETSDSINAGT
jgi:hypothetical protein